MRLGGASALRALTFALIVGVSGVYMSACATGDKQEATDQIGAEEGGEEGAAKKDKKAKKGKGKKGKKKEKAAGA